MKRFIFLALAIFIWIPIQALSAQAPPQKEVFTIDDMFRLEEIEDVSFSPDGKWIAYVRHRPRAVFKGYEPPYLYGLNRGDVWLYSIKNRSQTQLTRGESGESGYGSPVWSPDSKRLAVVWIHGADARLCTVDLTGELKTVSDRTVDLFTTPVWLSENLIAFTALPRGERPARATVDRRAGDKAIQQWNKVWSGGAATASVLESGVPSRFEARPKGALIFVDVGDAANRVVGEGYFVQLTPSPDKKWLAALEQIDNLEPAASEPLKFSSFLGSGRLVVFSQAGHRLPVVGLTPFKIAGARLEWSPSRQDFSLLAETSEGFTVHKFRFADNEDQALMAGLVASRVTPPINKAEPLGMIWTGSGNLIAKFEASQASKKRSDWWLIPTNGTPKNLSSSFKEAPDRLFRETGDDSFFGVADETLWRIFPDDRAPARIVSEPEPKINSIIATGADPDGGSDVIAASGKGSAVRYYQIHLATGKTQELIKPDADVKFVAFQPAASQLIFSSATNTGSRLWLVDVTSKATLIVVAEVNSFLRNIAAGKNKKINYRSLEGKDLTGWVLLPPSYRSDKKYPMVTWVYPGTSYGDSPEYLSQLNLIHALNLQLLAARGYLVLFPSIPLKPTPNGKDLPGSDPYLELENGVLPAVDKAIELGYADPNRVAVLGHSFGGFGTYALITQTNRFKAAIAMAGIADWISLYGTFDPRHRYDEFAHENPFHPALMETGQTRMGNPPWQDLGRYLKNSPLFYVDRVETPLLIIQGDMDYVPLTQGEEFFTALYRQGKRARFVRYWGEGHLVNSPANIRDFWNQVFAWFDEFCDISRDVQGNLIFDGDHVQSQNGAPSLKPEDFSPFNEVELKNHSWLKAPGSDARESATGQPQSP